MKFVSVDGELKRVAHTSGVIEMIGADPVEIPVEKIPGLQECAMAAGCIPYADTPVVEPVPPPAPTATATAAPAPAETAPAETAPVEPYPAAEPEPVEAAAPAKAKIVK